jgi:hypothetical protein
MRFRAPRACLLAVAHKDAAIEAVRDFLDFLI